MGFSCLLHLLFKQPTQKIAAMIKKMTNKKTMKTIVFSLALSAMTLTANNLNAQNNGGLFGRGESADSDNLEFNSRGFVPINGNTSSGITNDSFDPVSIGSGIALLIGAGLGYVALKKKEEKQ